MGCYHSQPHCDYQWDSIRQARHLLISSGVYINPRQKLTKSLSISQVEIWRTSTFEPTIGDGIIWTYIKDVTQYIPLFSDPGEFTFELDNLIETGLDGIYSSEWAIPSIVTRTADISQSDCDCDLLRVLCRKSPCKKIRLDHSYIHTIQYHWGWCIRSTCLFGKPSIGSTLASLIEFCPSSILRFRTTQ